jgi:Ca2+-transporting ATPase
MTNWHQLDLPSVLRELRTDQFAGLTEEEVSRRLEEYGRNELVGSGIKNPWLILWEQLTALMMVILIIAGVVSALLGDYKDAIAIGAIVVLNAILGFSQEYRAEKAMAALRKLAVPTVRVRRGGEVQEVSAMVLVPGDVVLLEAGNLVAADCRILESADLQTHEAALTGESEPIRKTTAAMEAADAPLGDRRNMTYMGTFITAGRGLGVVTETGMRTQLGLIAKMIQTVEREVTPLQRRLSHLGKVLAAAALLLVAVIFVLGLLRGEDLKLLFLTAVSIGVAAVPEGLPAVVTIALTLGAQRMLRRKVLIRKLPAVETLGSVTVICSDKTGTLTENRMTAAVLKTTGGEWNLLDGEEAGVALEPAFRLLLAGGALCNNAIQQGRGGNGNSSQPLGDPTETALVAAASRFGLWKDDLDRVLPRVGEVPFSSERKRMTTVHSLPSDGPALPDWLQPAADGTSKPYVAFTKGAVDSLLEISDSVWVGQESEPLTAAGRAQLRNANDDLAKKGMRVLGVGFHLVDQVQPGAEAMERNLTFAGMVGIIDPPRPEAEPAVARCKAAGIRPVMITGDHPLTAQNIAAKLGINHDGRVVTGPELDRLSGPALEVVAETTPVYARVSPEHKLRIVEGLQRRGNIVAMTGDGVNDAPALKKADIGVAMGITGTDVAKEAADMVLLDDNFATIVAAVEEGRVIYDNVRKFIKYILATNSGEIWLMLAAPFFGMPLPLLPLQILWMNLVTDGLPALALGVEAPESDTMQRPPRRPDENIFSRGMGRHVLWVGLLMAILSLGAGFFYWRAGDSHWQTILFTTLTLSQMAHVMAIRSESQSLFRIGLMSNKALLGAVSLTLLLQLALIYTPFLQSFFKTEPLPPADLVLTLALSSVIFAAVELEKWLTRSKRKESLN